VFPWQITLFKVESQVWPKTKVRVRQSRYSALQADEFTDILTVANLFLFVRNEINGEVHDGVLSCQPLPTRATGEAIFEVINDFVKDSHLDWGRCVGISTDGARAMPEAKNGVIARVQAVVPEAKSTQCYTHREALAIQDTPADLNKVLDEAVKIVNFVKARLSSQLL
jgi:hypothetical protein